MCQAPIFKNNFQNTKKKKDVWKTINIFYFFKKFTKSNVESLDYYYYYYYYFC